MIKISSLFLHHHLFLSSPGDVTDERALAKEVIERLASERAYRERLRQPSACNSVVVIFG